MLIHSVSPLPHFLSFENECNQKAKGLLGRFYCALISFYPLQPLASRAHFFSCFDLKMQWKYLAFR